MTCQEYYENLSLPPIPIKECCFQIFQKPKMHTELENVLTEIECIRLQERVKSAVDKTLFDWTEKHEELIHRLNNLESEKTELEQQYQTQFQCHKKALKEVQLYRTRYDHLLQRYFLENNNATRKSHAALSGRLSHCSAVRMPTDDLLDTASARIGSEDDDEFDILSILSDPLDSSLTFPESLPAQQEEINNEIKDDTETLIFACSDGFWNTISQGKSSKSEVDTLVSNYLCRGGNPNVAKSSESVRNIKEGYSLVHALVATKNTLSLRRILQAGAKPNVFPLTDKAEEMITPLVLAAKVRHLNSIRALVEKSDADLLNAKGPSGENVLHAAVENNSGEIIDYVLKMSQNALLEKTDYNGATPLHYACISGRTNLIVMFAKERHAKLSPRDNKGETPLHYAVRHRQLKAVTTLIELGASPNDSIPKQTLTPLDLAKQGGLDTIANFIKLSGGKTTKEIEKASLSVKTSNSFASGDSSETSPPNKSIKHYLQMKTTQILKGK